jgi:hypothetical protein
LRAIPRAGLDVHDVGVQREVRAANHRHLILREKTGAGEGIRTLDPDLGKVVLYP